MLVIALEVVLGFADKDMLCHQQPTRMGIERLNAGSCRPALQSPAVLVMRIAG